MVQKFLKCSSKSIKQNLLWHFHEVQLKGCVLLVCTLFFAHKHLIFICYPLWMLSLYDVPSVPCMESSRICKKLHVRKLIGGGPLLCQRQESLHLYRIIDSAKQKTRSGITLLKTHYTSKNTEQLESIAEASSNQTLPSLSQIQIKRITFYQLKYVILRINTTHAHSY